MITPILFGNRRHPGKRSHKSPTVELALTKMTGILRAQSIFQLANDHWARHRNRRGVVLGEVAVSELCGMAFQHEGPVGRQRSCDSVDNRMDTD